MFRGVLLISLGVFVLFDPSHVISETLKGAIAKAYLSNPLLQATRAKLRSIDEGVSQAKSGWRPKFNLDLDAGQKRVDSGKGWENRTPRTGSLSIEQNLFDGWRTKWDVENAKQAVLQQRAQLTLIEQNVLFEAVNVYMDVLRDKAVFSLNLSNESVVKRQLEATRDRFDVGEVTRTDVAQSEARLSRATADRIQAKGFLAMSRARYRRVIGDLPGTLNPAPAVEGLPKSEREAISLAKKNNPEILKFVHRSKGARSAIKRAEGGLYPTVDIEGNFKRKDEATSRTSSSEETSIIATISIPLYKGGAVSSRIRAAKQNWAYERRNLDVAIWKIEQETSQSWQEHKTAKARVKALSSEVRAARIALDGVEQEAGVGSRSVLDVLDAGQELLDARVNLVKAQREVTVSGFKLRRSIGTLFASKMDLGIKLYDPKLYLENQEDKLFGKTLN